MKHQNNAGFPSIGEDSRFETNSTANAFQSLDNLSPGHGSSTSAFQNFSEAIDFHLQKSVPSFQVVRSFRECQRGPYLVGKPKRILLHNVLLEPQAQTVVDSNASRTGWGTIHLRVPSSGIYSKEVTVSHHINELEMLAGENALHHYCPKIQGKFVQVKCDNSTVVHYLKNQGRTKSFSLCDIALRILNWCLITE